MATRPTQGDLAKLRVAGRPRWTGKDVPFSIVIKDNSVTVHVTVRRERFKGELRSTKRRSP